MRRLTFKCHKKAFTKTLFSYHNDIAQIQPTQTLCDAETVMRAFVFYRLGYWNAPLSVLLSSTAGSLQVVQNAAANNPDKNSEIHSYISHPGLSSLATRASQS